MMVFSPKKLKSNFRESVKDETLKENLAYATGQAASKREFLRLQNPIVWEENRKAIKDIRTKSVDFYQQLGTAFQKNFESQGGKVYFAANAEEANQIALDIISWHNGRVVVKGKSMVTEETELNQILERKGLEVWETDLGEFIVQLEKSKPVHIITPVINRNKKQIALLFKKILQMSYNEDPVTLTRFARNFLRRKFLEAEVGITGGNFLVAETGQVVLFCNEGNIRMSSTLTEAHIAITGIEKIIPSLHDMAPIIKMLPASATGQKITSYVSFLGGAQSNNSPEKQSRYVIIIDNNRSEMMKGKSREMLTCIHCGACLNVCPVFQRGGGHAYGSIYPGPMGIVLTPGLLGVDKAPYHALACSLCGKCDEVCPVQIPLSDLILQARNNVATQKTSVVEKGVWKLWSWITRNQPVLNVIRGLGAWLPFKLNWGLSTRKVPRVPRHSYLKTINNQPEINSLTNENPHK